MKFDTNAKIWECVSRDTSHPAIMQVNLRIKDTDAGREGWLEATNTYVLVRIPIELADDDTPGLVPVEALKSAAKLGGELSCTESACSDVSGRSWPRLETAFPETERLLSDTDSRGEHEGVCTFGVSAEHLVRVAKAMGAVKGGIRVTVGNPRKPLKIVAMGGVPGAECIVIPIRIAD